MGCRRSRADGQPPSPGTIRQRVLADRDVIGRMAGGICGDPDRDVRSAIAGCIRGKSRSRIETGEPRRVCSGSDGDVPAAFIIYTKSLAIPTRSASTVCDHLTRIRIAAYRNAGSGRDRSRTTGRCSRDVCTSTRCGEASPEDTAPSLGLVYAAALSVGSCPASISAGDTAVRAGNLCLYGRWRKNERSRREKYQRTDDTPNDRLIFSTTHNSSPQPPEQTLSIRY